MITSLPRRRCVAYAVAVRRVAESNCYRGHDCSRVINPLPAPASHPPLKPKAVAPPWGTAVDVTGLLFAATAQGESHQAVVFGVKVLLEPPVPYSGGELPVLPIWAG